MTAHALDLTKAGLIAALVPSTAAMKADAAMPAVRALAGNGAQSLAAAIGIYDNDDALGRRYALAACAAGRPAFWTIAGYHSQKACALQLAVHTLPTLEAALDDAYGPNQGTELQLAAFDTLVPLNRPAVAALALAYPRLDRWRDIEDLEARSSVDTRIPLSADLDATGACDKKLAGYILDGVGQNGFHDGVNEDSAARRTVNGASAMRRARGRT